MQRGNGDVVLTAAGRPGQQHPGQQRLATPRWHVSSIKLKSFKNHVNAQFGISSSGLVGITGQNGSGKSNLLEALCFLSGCSAAFLRVKALREVASTDGSATQQQVRACALICWHSNQAWHPCMRLHHVAAASLGIQHAWLTECSVDLPGSQQQ